MSFQIEADAKIIRIIFAGEITSAEIGDLARELARLEAGFARTPDRLTDLSAVEKLDSNNATVERLAEASRTRVFPNRIRSAIVATRLLDYGMARMFQMLSENPQIDLQIFKTRAEAEAWLAAKV